MTTTEVVTLLLIVLVAFGWYLSYSAARLDRLHARIEGTHSALDAQLVRRAEATLEVVNTGSLDAASSLILANAAAESLDSVDSSDSEREPVESDLSAALEVAITADVADALRAEPAGAESLDRLGAAAMRVQLARRFHNDAVTDVRRVRRKGTVKTFRLAGHAPWPRTFEFDDEIPAPLRD